MIVLLIYDQPLGTAAGRFDDVGNARKQAIVCGTSVGEWLRFEIFEL